MKNRIAELRARAGLTQEALAKRIGVSRRTAIALEGQNYTPSVRRALLLAEALEAPVEEVYILDDQDRVPLDAAAGK